MDDSKPAQFRSAKVAGADGKTNLVFDQLGGTRVAGSTGLKVIPGQQVVFNWAGHGALSSTSLTVLVASLPPSLRWVRAWLTLVPSDCQFRDVTDVFILGHWMKFGQKHHFMRDSSQTVEQAYEAAVGWIFGETREAVRVFREAQKALGRYAHDPTTSPTPYYFDAINDHLGNALHALQDSFAPGHVERDSDMVITNIFVYDKENQKPSKPGRLPHEEYDKAWQDSNGKLTKIGAAAVEASQNLLKCFVYAGTAANDHLSGAEFETRKADILDAFLKTHFVVPLGIGKSAYG